MQQAVDFREESYALFELLDPLPDADFARATGFKGWTLNNILQHLHFFNVMAEYSLTDPDRFQLEYDDMRNRRQAGGTMIGVTDELLNGLHGRALLRTWHDYFHVLAEHFDGIDPRHRVKWAGPDMSARSSITARLMETWAHGQAAWDLLGVERVNTDRIKNVAVIGVNTFAWTFKNRGMEPPGPPPYLRLTAPSGEIWEWHEPSEADAITGAAEQFCQVVTQTRNIADTSLLVHGDTAGRWMELAQCFAGPPEDPPAPGTRG